MAVVTALALFTAVVLLGWPKRHVPQVDFVFWESLLGSSAKNRAPVRASAPPWWVRLIPVRLEGAVARLRRRRPEQPDRLARMLTFAGLADRVSPEQFLCVWVGAPLLMGTLLLAIYALAPSRIALVMTVGSTMVAALLPYQQLQLQVQKRQRAIRSALPSMLTTLGVLLDAGVNLAPAFMEVAERQRGVMGDLLAEALHQHRLGTPLTEALYDAAGRAGVQELTVFVSALAQAAAKGAAGISATVRAQSRQMWVVRQHETETLGHELSQDLFLILLLLAFPAMAIFLLGPIGMSIYTMFF